MSGVFFFEHVFLLPFIKSPLLNVVQFLALLSSIMAVISHILPPTGQDVWLHSLKALGAVLLLLENSLSIKHTIHILRLQDIDVQWVCNIVHEEVIGWP